MYRLLAISLFASTTLASPMTALAASFDFDSSIDNVLVFPRGAQVTRIASGEVPVGEHVIVVDDLPGRVIPESIRVRGRSDGKVTQTSFDVKEVVLSSGDKPAERKRIEGEIEDLEFERGRISRQLEDLELQRQILQSLASRALSSPTDGRASGISAINLDGLLESAATRLGRLQEQEGTALERQNAIGDEIADLQIQLNSLAPQTKAQTAVIINVSAEEASATSFEIEYRVEEAAWWPVYDARLTMESGVSDAGIELNRRAEVAQQTGEAWDNVSLSLSTARPSSATTAPQLGILEIDERPEPVPTPQPRSKSVLGVFSTFEGSSVSQAEADAAAPIEEAGVNVELAGFQAVFTIPGKSRIENKGERRTVNIDKFDLATDLHALSVPRLDATAYLMAEFKHEGETPLLPGKVSLTRDGVFVGTGQLPLIAKGESHELGFGSDDQIVVERVETSKRKGESGFVSTVNTDLRTYRTNVTNNHDFEIPVKILDRMPVSNQEDIGIEIVSGSTPATSSNVDDKRGILEWEHNLAAGEKWTVDFGYEVTWPEEMKISRID